MHLTFLMSTFSSKLIFFSKLFSNYFGGKRQDRSIFL